MIQNTTGPEGAKAIAGALSSGTSVLIKLELRGTRTYWRETSNASDDAVNMAEFEIEYYL